MQRNGNIACSTMRRTPGDSTSKLTVNYGLRWEVYFPEYVNGKGQGGFTNINLGDGHDRVAGI